MTSREISNLEDDVRLEEIISRVLAETGTGDEIQVIAREGFVYLLGRMGSLGQKRRAAATVMAIPGVIGVINHIRLETPSDINALAHF